MNDARAWTFKRPDEAWEFEALHRLNYAAFVEEIPQHAANAERRLVDRFHEENEYLIGVDVARRELLGMAAIRGRRPFSLDQKLPDLDRHLDPRRRPCEVRLWTVIPRLRRTAFVPEFLAALVARVRELGFDQALISGTTRQVALYQRMGFRAFGPLVGAEGAYFQPMELDVGRFWERLSPSLSAALGEREPLNLLPGPVPIAAETRSVFASAPISHRDAAFLSELRELRRDLSRALGAEAVEVLVGSGTLANDVVAAELAGRARRVLIPVDGEFGARLVDHARRAGLEVDEYAVPWGSELELDELTRRAARADALWAVHCETSTGALHDLAALKRVAAAARIALALDATSSIGVVPVDLAGVELATCTSGKGLASYPGLALVFHRAELGPATRPLPRYLDLRAWASHDGVPFTHSSNLVRALASSWRRAFASDTFERRVALARELCGRLAELGLAPLVPTERASPGVVTLALGARAETIALRLAREGVWVSWRSAYLRERGWVQLCLFGEHDADELARLGEALRRALERGARARS
ncbi:MAG: alanine--glyoxylate aminotransferase family protein [Planctomycetes bacterium]|nr:alanine--glyoxylate aminotransferase family protein [Planctomycetota bacterium]